MAVLDEEIRKRGYSLGHLGTRYMKAAVGMIAARPEVERIYRTKEVYPAIARAAGAVSWQSVERAMRYAVKAARPGQTVAAEMYEMAAVVRAHED